MQTNDSVNGSPSNDAVSGSSFMASVDAHLERIKAAIVGANTKGRNPEILLDMYDLLSEAVENIEALLSGE